MINLKYYLIVFLSLFILQCSNEIPTSNEPVDSDLGKIVLKIDKSNAPANVVMVEAFLTRANYDTIYGSLDLLSSTSADITIEDIAAGEWHLKVDAKDSSGVVLYTGETDVNILAGVLTQVNLTLIPTGQGTGNIYIYVNWGASSKWVDFINNPVFTTEDSPFNPFTVTQGVIIKDGSTFKMWYNNIFASAVGKVGYAHSQEGINWIPDASYALTPGSNGSWDDYSVGVGFVLKDGDDYLMYYSGNHGESGYWHIGLATSTDGINWTKHPSPVLSGITSERQLHPNTVLKVNGQYLMYYTFRNPNSFHFHNIGMAVSSDGINWVRNSNNPVLPATQNWEGSGIYYPSVVYENNTFKMVYMNTQATAFGMAESPDGFNWTKSNANPLFTKEDTYNNWAHRDIAYPYIFKVDNEYRIYYSGGHINSYNCSIGFVRKFGSL